MTHAPHARPITRQQPPSRRAVVRGASWAVPAIAATAAAPAFAASRVACGTLKWTDTTLSGTQGTNGVRTGKITLADGKTVTVTVTQQRVSGYPGYDRSVTTTPTPTQGDFSVTAAGGQKAYGGGSTWNSQGYFYTVDPSTTASVLTLNQASAGTTAAPIKGEERITFSFRDSTGQTLTAKSISFNMYDITSQTVAQGAAKARSYTDQVSFTGAALETTGSSGAPATYTTTSTSITGTSLSTNAGNRIGVTLTPTSSTVSLTYRNTNTGELAGPYQNYQYIGLGDLQICF